MDTSNNWTIHDSGLAIPHLPPSAYPYVNGIPIDASNIKVGPPHPVDLTVVDFNTTAQLTTLVTLIDAVMTDISYDAVANLYLPVSLFRNVFQFSIDDAVQLHDPNGNLTDLHFYVMDNQIDYLKCPVGNAAIVSDDSAITRFDVHTGKLLDVSSQLIIPHDYLRYLAQQIFGTWMGVDLISNQNEIIRDMCNNITNVWNVNDLGILHSISTTGNAEGLLEDENGLHFYDNRDPNEYGHHYNNIEQTIFNELLTRDPSRFAVGEGQGHIKDTAQIQPLPFGM